MYFKTRVLFTVFLFFFVWLFVFLVPPFFKFSSFFVVFCSLPSESLEINANMMFVADIQNGVQCSIAFDQLAVTMAER